MFFKKKEEQLKADIQQKLPPGQSLTEKWPVLHYGLVPSVDAKSWRFEIRPGSKTCSRGA